MSGSWSESAGDVKLSPLGQGFAAACALGGAGAVGVRILYRFIPLNGRAGEMAIAAAISSLFLVPFAMGITAAWFWAPLRLTIGQTLLHSLTCTVLGGTCAAVFLGEGSICLIIGSPLIYICIAGGALFGRTLFRKRRDGPYLLIFPALLLAIAGEPQLRRDREGVVTGEILIRAPAAKVWPHILAFDTIPAPPEFWLFRLGLPYPTATTNAGNFVGADRACIFSGNAVFRERVAELVPNERLTFEIVEIPPDPELMGHLSPHRGRFILRENGDGTTTLVGSTWYTLHVRPLWYFDWWTHHIFRAVHLRVMENVRRLAETR